MSDKYRRFAAGLVFFPLLVFILAMLAGCNRTEREVPATELPVLPPSASLPCEVLTDAEVIACLKGEDTREICRKLDVTCARYKNLQSFVRRTWVARDGK